LRKSSPHRKVLSSTTQKHPLNHRTRLFLKVNKPLLKPALSLSKHLPHGLFLNKRPPPNKALHPNTSKRAKTSVSPSPKLEKFFKSGVVRGKIVKSGYFREQGLEVFLDKLRDQGWLELFTNTQMGCSPPDLTEFYANVSCH